MRRHLAFTLLTLVAALALALGGCGASAPSMSYAPEAPYRDSPAPAAAAPEATAAYDADEAEESFQAARRAPSASMENRSDSDDGNSLKKSGESSAGKTEPSTPPPPPPATASAPAEQPIIVYSGYLRLRVKRLIETIDAITAQAEKLGGYIESMTAQVVVVRVPVATFDAAISAFEGMGTVLQREVKSLDVTARFTDMAARLAVAQQSRARLLALLETTQDVQQRLRILEEIKRLSEQIETIQSTLGTLRKLADYSTITLALEPVLSTHATEVHRSAFPWVRGLEAHRATLTEGKDKIGFNVPTGFVLFEEDDSYRAQAADTSTLRAGVVENEPRGDADFWLAAVDHELTGRDEEPMVDGKSGGLSWRAYRSKDAQPRYYLVGVLAAGDELLVLEGFFPTAEAFHRHKDAVVVSLGSFEAR